MTTAQRKSASNQRTYKAAVQYISRGYGVVLLHGVHDGICTCATGVACAAAGKHPVEKAWQRTPITSKQRLAAKWERRHDLPTNVGILLREEDRLLLLDIDTKKGKNGDQTLTTWSAELDIDFDKYLLQTTPSGGSHYLFRIPEAFRGTLPNHSAVAPGIDVYHAAKQFVVAPSATEVGKYRAVSTADLLPMITDVPEVPAALLNRLASIAGRDAASSGQAVDPTSLRAPTIELVRKLVQAMPNPDGASYDDYIAVAHAIKGACGIAKEYDARTIFHEWSGRWEGGHNDPDTNDAKFDSIEWKTLHSGWRHLIDLAVDFRCPASVLTDIANAEAAEDFEADLAASQFVPTHPSQVWDDPIPLTDSTDEHLPPFPIGSLPPLMRRFVETASASLEVPLDFAAIVLIGAVAGAAQRRYVLRVSTDYREPLCLYLIVVAESGERKTPTVRIFREAFDDAQAQMLAQARPEIARAKAQRELLEREKQTTFGAIGAARKELAKINAGQDSDQRKTTLQNRIDQLENRIFDLIAELEEHQIPSTPLLWLSEATPEAVAKHLGDLGSLIVFASEGDMIDVAAGQYADKTAKLGILLSAYSMDTFVESRMDGMRVAIDPRLTVILAIQPSVIDKLQRVREFHERGLTPRFLYSAPASMVGKRSWDNTVAIDEKARSAYVRLIDRLLDVDRTIRLSPLEDPNEDEHQQAADVAEPPVGAANGSELLPGGGTAASYRELRLSSAAHALFQQYGQDIEAQLIDDDFSLSAFRTWGSKLPGQMLRLAAVLHIMAANESGDAAPHETPIGADTVVQAIALANYFRAHTLRLFVGRSRTSKRERMVLEWIRSNGDPEFGLRDLYRSLRRQFDEDMTCLRTTLDRLQDLGWLRRSGRDTSRGKGRPPERYVAHPTLLAEANS